MGFALVPKPRAGVDQLDRDRERKHRQTAAAEVDRLERLLSAAAADRPQAEAAGLVDGADSDASPPPPPGDGPEISNPAETAGKDQGCVALRTGGLTKRGALMLEDFCACTRQDGTNYGFWTVTLSPAMVEALDATPRGVARFQDALRRRFSEALARACRRESTRYRRWIHPHWAFVVEPQSRGVPHWHLVFRCRARRGSRWLMPIAHLDALIVHAVEVATGQAIPAPQAGNIGLLRKDPGSYLSKYLRKGKGQGGAAAVLRAGHSENMLPGQWWGIATCSKRMIERCSFHIPSVLVGWLSRNWPGLAGIGALTAGIYIPPAEGAPAVVCGRWHGIDGLERVVESLCSNWWQSYAQARTPATA